MVRVGEYQVRVSTGNQRVLLAALLLRANHVVPLDELVKTVWEGSPPQKARVTLQNYVKRLRRALGPDGPQQAWDAWQQSLAILDDLRHPEADEVREKLRRLGPAHRATLAGRPAADGR